MSDTFTLDDITESDADKPLRGIIYGPHGMGKTTLAAGAPSPIFLPTEDGLRSVKAKSFPRIRTYAQFMSAIGTLYAEDHSFETAIIDSIDWLEPIVWKSVAEANGWKDIEQPGYGKGYMAALDAWREIIEGLNALRDERRMNILMIAHCNIKRFDAPDTDPYDRYMVKLHEKASALLQENVDSVFFLNQRVSVRKADVGFKKEVARGIGAGSRVLYTAERPAYVAKNRDNMPHSIDLPDDPALMWPTVAAHIPYFNIQNKDQ